MESNEPSMHRGAVVKAEPVAAWRWDPAGKVLTWSEGMFEVFGVRPSEFQGHGHPLMEFSHPDDRAMVTGQLMEIREGAKPRPLECRLVRADGAVRWVRVEGDTFTDEVGKLLVVGIVRDITERRRAEEALRESEGRYRTLFEKSLDGIGLVIDGKIAACNESMAELLEYSVEELRGRSPIEFVIAEDRDLVAERMRALMQGGPEYRAEYRLVTKGGTIVPVEALSQLIKYDDLQAILSLVRDITERKRAEEALQMRDEVNRTLLDAIPDMMFRLDKDGTYLDFIPAKGQKPFVPPVEFMGRTVDEILPPAPARGIMQQVKLALESGETLTYEYELTVDDKPRNYEARIVATDTNEVLVLAREVSEQKRAEEALRASEEKWRSVLENAQDLVCLVTPDLKVSYLNRTVPGLEMEGVVGKDVLDFIASEHHDAAREAVERVIRTGVSETFEIRGTGPDDEDAWYLCRLGPVKVADKVVSVACVATDVTKRKQAEEALRTSEEFLARAQHVARIGSWDHDMTTGQIRCSDELLRMYGIKPDQFGGTLEALLPAIHPDDRARVIAGNRAVYEENRAEPVEFRITAPGAPVLVAWAEVEILRDEAGKAVRMTGTVQDVTDRKKAEEALRESEERYRTVCERSVDGISLVVDGRIEYTNPRLCEMLGYSEEELSGRPALDFVVPEEREQATERLQALLQGYGEQTSRFRFVKKDGTVVALEGSGRAIQLRGKPGLLHVVRDVTEQAEPEVAEDEMAALTAARAALEEVAPLLPRDSLADLASARALSKIYKLLIRQER